MIFQSLLKSKSSNNCYCFSMPLFFNWFRFYFDKVYFSFLDHFKIKRPPEKEIALSLNPLWLVNRFMPCLKIWHYFLMYLHIEIHCILSVQVMSNQSTIHKIFLQSFVFRCFFHSGTNASY